ncbi:restriction endonuclease [Streptomyces filamentosus]|uniref:restriction endonuclease n=1 Tax=Streptomyces filamentosus TaxID=67294 RepID=UPI0033EAC010
MTTPNPGPAIPLRIGEDWWVPSQEYVDSWQPYTRSRWEAILASYRERAAEYPDLTKAHPEEFALLGPVELRIVVCLVGEWTFIRPAAQDAITLDERWDAPQLSTRGLLNRADAESIVRRVTAVGDDFELLQAEDYTRKLDVKNALSFHDGNERYDAREKADQDARNAVKAPQWREAIDALTGRTIDHATLAKLRERLEEIRQLKAGARGNQFEPWVGELLQAHGCEAEGGKKHLGEQVDFFVHKPFRAIIECRWQRARLQPRALNDLTGKLARRPAIIAGIYVAMSGFTDACRENAASEPHQRTVLLWDEDDIQRLLNGEIHALDLYEEHVSTRVRRYGAAT